MATTVNPAIGNSIGLASQYVPLLDEIYKAESKTAILDTVQDRVRWSPEYHTFYLFETAMGGLGNYDRNAGFVRGDVTASWRAYAPQWDRGRQFLVDRIDNAESMGLAFGTLAAEFIRTKVVPETDALSMQPTQPLPIRTPNLCPLLPRSSALSMMLPQHLTMPKFRTKAVSCS